MLSAFAKYKDSLDLALKILRATTVNIDNYQLDPSSYQMEDNTLVTDKRPIDYKPND